RAAIDGCGAAAEMQPGERVCGPAIAPRGSQPMPFGRLLVVALDAQAIGVELAEQRHRLRVLLLLHPTRRGPKGGDVVAALVGAVSDIGLAAGGGPPGGPGRPPGRGGAGRRPVWGRR